MLRCLLHNNSTHNTDLVRGTKIFKTMIEGSGPPGYASSIVCLKCVSLQQNSNKSPLTVRSNCLACGQIKKKKKIPSAAVLPVRLWLLHDGLQFGSSINDFISYNNIIILYTIYKIREILGPRTSALRPPVTYDNTSKVSSRVNRRGNDDDVRTSIHQPRLCLSCARVRSAESHPIFVSDLRGPYEKPTRSADHCYMPVQRLLRSRAVSLQSIASVRIRLAEHLSRPIRLLGPSPWRCT